MLSASSRLGQETFAFDPAGNLLDPTTADQRQYSTREKAEQPQFTSQLTGSNKLLDNLLRNYAGKHFEYDERGNLRARIDNGRTQQFEWDHFNRLAAVRSNEVDTEFAYDPLGRRLLKHSTPKLPVSASAQAAANPAWLASETARLSRERGYGVTLYGWDGDQIAWEGDAETTTHYAFEPGSFVPLLLAKAKQRIALIPTPDWSERDYDIDADPLWTYSPEPQPFEQLYFYHTDHLGTPQELTDAEGNLAWSADYKAWGEAKAVISEAAKRAGITNPLRFQGQYFDHETGLHYNRHRYYDPSVGRFISKDPIGLQGGLNIFAYAPNPVEWIDPLGLANKYRRANGQYGKKPGPKPTKNTNTGHGNSLCTTKPAVGYILVDKDDPTKIVKYGETTSPIPTQRYSEKEYDEMNARMIPVKKGTKCEMHKWQHDKIMQYKASHNGERPKYNFNDY